MSHSHLETLDLARSLEATEKGKDDQPGHPLYTGIWKENVRMSLFDINISVFCSMLDKFQKQVCFRYIQKKKKRFLHHIRIRIYVSKLLSALYFKKILKKKKKKKNIYFLGLCAKYQQSTIAR